MGKMGTVTYFFLTCVDFLVKRKMRKMGTVTYFCLTRVKQQAEDTRAEDRKQKTEGRMVRALQSRLKSTDSGLQTFVPGLVSWVLCLVPR
jgi:hypothetical protein